MYRFQLVFTAFRGFYIFYTFIGEYFRHQPVSSTDINIKSTKQKWQNFHFHPNSLFSFHSVGQKLVQAEPNHSRAPKWLKTDFLLKMKIERTQKFSHRPHHSSNPLQAPPARLFTSSPPPCWLAGWPRVGGPPSLYPSISSPPPVLYPCSTKTRELECTSVTFTALPLWWWFEWSFSIDLFSSSASYLLGALLLLWIHFDLTLQNTCRFLHHTPRTPESRSHSHASSRHLHQFCIENNLGGHIFLLPMGLISSTFVPKKLRISPQTKGRRSSPSGTNSFLGAPSSFVVYPHPMFWVGWLAMQYHAIQIKFLLGSLISQKARPEQITLNLPAAEREELLTIGANYWSVPDVDAPVSPRNFASRPAFLIIFTEKPSQKSPQKNYPHFFGWEMHL